MNCILLFFIHLCVGTNIRNPLNSTQLLRRIILLQQSLQAFALDFSDRIEGTFQDTCPPADFRKMVCRNYLCQICVMKFCAGTFVILDSCSIQKFTAGLGRNYKNWRQFSSPCLHLVSFFEKYFILMTLGGTLFSFLLEREYFEDQKLSAVKYTNGEGFFILRFAYWIQ